MYPLLTQPDLILGTADGRTDTLSMPYSERSAHMHVIGRTRSGKSRFLADLIQQDIINGNGLCLIDPHGELFDLTMNWLAQNPWVKEVQPNIHPVRLSDPDTTFCFNPLKVNSPAEVYTASGNVRDAITRIYGGKDANETPQFAYVVDIICTTLAKQGLPLAAAGLFLTNKDEDVNNLRNEIIKNVDDPYFKRLGEELSSLSPKEFRETMGSTTRRLHDFIRNPMIRRIFLQTENTIDLKTQMDEGHVLLIDASEQGGGVSNKELQTVASLLVNNIFSSAKQRNPRDKPKPFMLYIDEVQNYVNNDIEEIVSQSAKRGLYLTLAHQTLGQLIEAGQLIYKGVMSGTLLKTVFNIPFEEAEILADELFAGEIEFERVKEKLASPHVVGHETIKLKSESQSTSAGHATGRARSEASSTASGYSDSVGTSQGESLTMPTDGAGFGNDAINQVLTTSRMSGSASMSSESSAVGHSESESYSDSQSFSQGESESLKPILEWFSTTAYSLEEQRYELKRRLSLQPKRHGYFAIIGKGTCGFTTRDVPDLLDIPELEANLIEELTVRTPWLSLEDMRLDVTELPAVQALIEEQKNLDDLLDEDFTGMSNVDD